MVTALKGTRKRSGPACWTSRAGVFSKFWAQELLRTQFHQEWARLDEAVIEAIRIFLGALKVSQVQTCKLTLTLS